ncbi:MAG: YihY/virulence factor BrkB family protein [Gemmatimonas sp.]
MTCRRALAPRVPLTGVRARVEPWWDILRRVWNQSAEDNVPFLAGGLAFNILLALVPFVLLLISGLSFLLGREPVEAAATVTALVEQLLPNDAPSASALLRGIVTDVLSTRSTVTIYSAIVFAWFSTRLFGSLRSVLALIFDGTDRGIMAGKVFDFLATIVATVAVSVYVVFSAYLDLATTRGFALLRGVGLAQDAMSGVEYLVGRLLALALVLSLFYALYRGLPRRRPNVHVALVAAITATVLFEAARYGFAKMVSAADPGSLYTGTIAAVVAVVFWTYYSAFLFLIGGEVAQAYDLRRRELAALRNSEAAEHDVSSRVTRERTAPASSSPSSRT